MTPGFFSTLRVATGSVTCGNSVGPSPHRTGLHLPGIRLTALLPKLPFSLTLCHCYVYSVPCGLLFQMISASPW